jgi:hypothetical protein
MRAYRVTLGRPGGGSATFTVAVNAATPDIARAIAEAQNAPYRAHAVKGL